MMSSDFNLQNLKPVLEVEDIYPSHSQNKGYIC